MEKQPVALCVDTNNIIFRVSSAHSKYADQSGTAEDRAGLAVHSALQTMLSHHRKIQPDIMALTFEGSNNWRKTYTKSDECVSKRLYKGNRVIVPGDDSMIAFFALLKSFEELIREHSAIPCLQNPLCEGDDMFTAFVEKYTSLGYLVYGLSGDKDFVQLLKYPNFVLLNPDKLGAKRDVDKKGNKIDPEYFMFEKAIRGDAGDNVMSAFPRVRSTRLQKAFTDEYERTNLMNETWTFNEPSTGEERIFRVGDLFEENQLLMNLSRQPAHIREAMFSSLEEAVNNTGKADFFAFTKFCGKFKLKKIMEESDRFMQMLANRPQPTAYVPEQRTAAPVKKKLNGLVF